ncbi:MAG: glycerate kinase type-2 family protein, partial [Promethearchaeota archaeon]
YHAGHPLPNEGSLLGAKEMLRLASRIKIRDVVFCLISGGGSALLTLPPDPIKLLEIQELNKQLLECGADINEINTIRKHVSLVKGGWLAWHFRNATLISLIMSDVVGDDLSTIASGPTVPDPMSYDDAMKVVEKYQIKNKVPRSIIEHLERGMNGAVEETPKPGNVVFKSVYNFIIANASVAANRIMSECRRKKQSCMPFIVTNRLQGDVVSIAKFFKDLLYRLFKEQVEIDVPGSEKIIGSKTLHLEYEKASEDIENSLLIFTGESTVAVKGSGIGGRNQELLLHLITLIGSKRLFDFVVLGCGMDGKEGNSPAAGAIVDNYTFKRAGEMGLVPERFLENNNSFRFFSRLNDAVITGLTGTNVNDMLMIYIRKRLSKVEIR